MRRLPACKRRRLMGDPLARGTCLQHRGPAVRGSAADDDGHAAALDHRAVLDVPALGQIAQNSGQRLEPRVDRAPGRRPRRRRSSSSTSGMLDVAIASQVSRRAAVPPAARRETGLDDALVRACASPPRTTKSLEVVPQREHGGSHESNHKHDHSPPRIQATCHPVRKIPPADPPRLRASTTSARRAAAPPCDGDGHGR